jgi:hypothetical protein
VRSKRLINTNMHWACRVMFQPLMWHDMSKHGTPTPHTPSPLALPTPALRLLFVGQHRRMRCLRCSVGWRQMRLTSTTSWI